MDWLIITAVRLISRIPTLPINSKHASIWHCYQPGERRLWLGRTTDKNLKEEGRVLDWLWQKTAEEGCIRQVLGGGAAKSQEEKWGPWLLGVARLGNVTRLMVNKCGLIEVLR